MVKLFPFEMVQVNTMALRSDCGERRGCQALGGAMAD